MKTTTLVLFAVSAALAVSFATIGADSTAKSTTTKQVKIPKYKNSDFYIDGKFQAEKARKAYFDMMESHGYFISENLRSNMWATDFGLGDFVNAGMGGIFWLNNQEQGYFGHEIFLLPGQMIVEHAHAATAKGKAKMESWHVRNGGIFTFGEEGNPIPAGVTLPASQEKYITVKKCYAMIPGEVRTLNRIEAKHFMIAGPQGAIVTEYGTFHDGDGLRFTNPGVKF
jgi:hypothetical protein